ncbi:MAG: AraC family transcriptional regulator [Caldimonas sp.]
MRNAFDNDRTVVRPIAFDRSKYGLPLQVDACAIGSIPGFIKKPLPHRLGFYEIALVTSGRGRLELDGAALDVAPYRLCLTRPQETRRWRLENAQLEGWLAFFEADFLDGFFADPCFVESVPAIACAAADRSIALTRKSFDACVDLVGAMADELRTPRSDSSHLLRADTYRLLMMLQRAGRSARVGEADPSLQLAARFAQLLASDARMGEGVAAYAGKLETTTRTLNRCLRSAFGRTAGELIQQHVLLASRRLLLQTQLSAAAIAERLEFSDASYFSRVFQRHMGMTPGTFRRQRKSASAVANVHCETTRDH